MASCDRAYDTSLHPKTDGTINRQVQRSIARSIVASCVELICYQLVVLRITLYVGIVVSSKRSTAAQARACDANIRVRIRDILTIREVRAAVHLGRNYS